MWDEFLFSMQSKMTSADNGMNDNNAMDEKYPEKMTTKMLVQRNF